MNEKIRLLEADIDKNDEKIDEISRETNRIKEVLRRRRQKDRKHRELSVEVNELKNSKTGIRIDLEAFKQIISLVKKAKDLV